MKLITTAFLLGTLAADVALAQSREETLKLISDTLAEVNNSQRAVYQNALPTSQTSEIIDSALQKIVDLRDELKDNPYVRISGFTVSIPWGVSVDLTFLD